MSDLTKLPSKIDLEGANNFRDMGGYPTAGGRRVKRGLLYRSDHLGNLTPYDLEILNDLGIRTVIDLRRESEREEIMDAIVDPGVKQIWLPVMAEGADVINLRRGIEEGTLSYDEARDYLISANRQFVRVYGAVYRRFMELVMDPDNYPMVFHCSAGKDRAGFAAALTLLSVGASKETVMHDYMATNHCTANYLNGMLDSLADQAEMRPVMETVHMLMQVDPDFIGAAFQAIEEDYATTDAYLEQGVGMGANQRDQLTGFLCEPA